MAITTVAPALAADFAAWIFVFIPPIPSPLEPLPIDAIFLSMLFIYYIIIVRVTDQLPYSGYREKAFKAITEKDANFFEQYRFPRP